MPTVNLQYVQRWMYPDVIYQLIDDLPLIVASQMNISGRELHDGGVGESEIIIDATEYSRFAQNVNDLQITVRAHRFEERVARLDEITEAIKQGVQKVVADFNHLDRAVKIGIEVSLVDMGYATIRKED